MTKRNNRDPRREGVGAPLGSANGVSGVIAENKDLLFCFAHSEAVYVFGETMNEENSLN